MHRYRFCPNKSIAAITLSILLAASLPGQQEQIREDSGLVSQEADGGAEPGMQTITAASNMLHPPFSSWGADGRAIGIEVQIVEAAAAKLGRRVNWIELPFSELFDAVDNGEIDIAVSTIGKSEERQEIVSFSIPYYETRIIALVKPDSAVNNLIELAAARIGADKSTTSWSAARKQWPQATIVGEVNGAETWPQMLEQGLIDAFVVDGSDQQRLESISGVLFRPLKQALATEQFCIAMKKNDPELKTAIDVQVTTIKPTVDLRIGGEYQFTSPLGKRISSLTEPAVKLIDDYIIARKRYHSNPQDADAIIWFGRRAGYLQRMNEAIRIFSDGIRKHPDDARMYRHRGHRYISTRQFDGAIDDFERAVRLIDGQQDQLEPDGAPNPQGIPLTTLHGNIWYHLGLAYYLKNDMDNALRCFRQCQKLNRNDDGVVSSAYWLYMILRRTHQDKEAASLVADIKPDMAIIENLTYHKMCLFYNGQITESDVLVSAIDGDTADQDEQKQSVADVLLYGMGNYHLYANNDKQKARRLYEALLKSGSPVSFAYIAAESDCVRLFGL